MGGHAAGSGLNGAPPPPIRYLTVARLRREARHAALSPLRRAGSRDGDASGEAGHHLTRSLFDDGDRRQRDFLWAAVGHYEYVVLSARPPSDRHNLFELGRTRLYWPRLAQGQPLPIPAAREPAGGAVAHGRRTVRETRHRDGRDRARSTERAGGDARRRVALARAHGREGGFRAGRGVPGGPPPRAPDRTARRYDAHLRDDRVRGTAEGDRRRAAAPAPRAGLGAGKAYGCGLLLLENWP